MTLENCKRLYEHFKKLGDEKKAALYAERVERRGGKLEEPKEEESKEDGKKSKR